MIPAIGDRYPCLRLINVRSVTAHGAIGVACCLVTRDITSPCRHSPHSPARSAWQRARWSDLGNSKSCQYALRSGVAGDCAVSPGKRISCRCVDECSHTSLMSIYCKPNQVKSTLFHSLPHKHFFPTNQPTHHQTTMSSTGETYKPSEHDGCEPPLSPPLLISS
jgi:hypothetical protein